MPNREDVRAALADYSKVHGIPAAQAILKTLGHTMSDLPESKFAEVLAATKQPPADNANAGKAKQPETVDALAEDYWNRRKTSPRAQKHE